MRMWCVDRDAGAEEAWSTTKRGEKEAEQECSSLYITGVSKVE